MILSSVVQYFPGEEYLRTVLGRCLELLRRLSSALKPGGRLAINEFSAAAPHFY